MGNWSDRNKRVMEGVVRASLKVVDFILQYIKELDACFASVVTYRDIGGGGSFPR